MSNKASLDYNRNCKYQYQYEYEPKSNVNYCRGNLSNISMIYILILSL